MKFNNYFVETGKKAEKLFKWGFRDVEIRSFDGRAVFSQKKVSAPIGWSDLAVSIAASKYFFFPKEKSVEQMVDRVASTISDQLLKQKFVKDRKQAQIFCAELKYILLSQKAFFNSPVWFNLGVFPKYSKSLRYQKPQVSACFIQKIEDHLDSIFNLLHSEARLFKNGSGSGTNFSPLRAKGEKLSGGGESSGLMAFLEVFDKAAGSIKSGGKTRRAAKMVCLDIDHPEILEFVRWKAKEEDKAAVLIRAGYEKHFEGEAYRTVSGQNSNNSVRVTDKFMSSANAQSIWQEIGKAAWKCADPGIQFDSTINKWNPVSASGKINASNPCSEFMFLDDTACNLASINLLKFLNEDGSFDWQAFRQTIKIMIVSQEVLVDFAGYPTPEIEKNSKAFRPLGLGFAGLGSLLMQMQIPYDSKEARGLASHLAAELLLTSVEVSVELAQEKRVFSEFKKNKKVFIKVMKQHLVQARSLNLEKSKKNELITRWKVALGQLEKSGIRNAQLTLMAPTGTIGLVMDADTMGIEPEFSLIKIKNLAGGGTLKMVSDSVQIALRKMKFSDSQITEILTVIEKTGSIASVPFLSEEQKQVFKTAVDGDNRYRISADGHLLMMAAIQPFLSGAISKTVNLPEAATVNDILDIYEKAWKLGLKSIAIYRDNSKASQILENVKELCPECKGNLVQDNGCLRCENCGYTTGCLA